MQKVVLITGVAGGIGKACAQLFYERGWLVIGVDQESSPGLSSVAHYFNLDIADAANISELLKQVETDVGRLDALVHNAAYQVAKPLIETELEEWDRTLAVNLRAVFMLSKAAYGLLRVNQGCIVNVSSVHALATSSNIAAYAASKGALSALTRALAIEWAHSRIRVNAVLPGAVDTPMLDDGLKRGNLSGSDITELKRQLAEKTVMGKIGRPSEIAESVMFLADATKSSFITGQSIVVDGGATARLSTE